MRTIKILDCTLRDGGFVNDWKFELPVIRDVIYRLDRAHIDIIEVGFLNQNVEDESSRSIFPRTASVNKLLDNIQIINSMIVAMVDFGTCDLDKIQYCKDTVIDGIRVIFKKKDIDGALSFCEQLKNKGYKVFVQPISITTYSDKDILALIEKVNKLKPYAMSIVDTYGLLFKKDLIRYFFLIDNNLDKEVIIGYHSHNNFQLAYANSMELLEVKTERNITIDGSLFGMGKGAGNANTELLALHLNNQYYKNYDIDQLLEIIDVYIFKIFEQTRWGYSLLHYISASNDCHPSYANYLIEKKTLSIKSINEILSNIRIEDKLSYNHNLIENAYLNYQLKSIDDSKDCKRLMDKLAGKRILLLVPGSSLKSHGFIIEEYINQVDPFIISVNFLPEDYDVNMVFVSNSKRYSQLLMNDHPKEKEWEVIATSNITESALKIDYSINYSSLISMNEQMNDNSTLMLLYLLIKLGIKQLAIAGFDGFDVSTNAGDYISEFYSFGHSVDSAVRKNVIISNVTSKLLQHLDIRFITPTNYSL